MLWWLALFILYRVEVNSNTTVNSKNWQHLYFCVIYTFLPVCPVCFVLFLYKPHAIDHLNRTLIGIDTVFPDFSNVLDNNKYIHETMTLNITPIWLHNAKPSNKLKLVIQTEKMKCNIHKANKRFMLFAKMNPICFTIVTMVNEYPFNNCKSKQIIKKRKFIKFYNCGTLC